eukprot:IDg20044t1
MIGGSSGINGAAHRGTGNSDNLNILCTVAPSPIMQPCDRGAAGDDDRTVESTSEADGNGTEDTTVSRHIFTMGVWESDSKCQRISTAIFMPSRIFAMNKDHRVRVSDDGMSLMVAVVWPSVLTDSALLRRSWINSDANFSRTIHALSPFCSFLHRLRAYNEE